ncbi:hypothetical protein NC651_015641 [Populus alba x Populus x berolinensis]|nr:hypothetical protein NC651_015641 [Populus alba x Populus x berolinensis]
MDWGNVTAEDLIDALREVDWSSPPRPLSEFFSRFTLPKSSSKWNSRLKCNLYYYRTNYFIMMVLIMGLGFLRRPLAIVAALLTALSIAFMNDSCFCCYKAIFSDWTGNSQAKAANVYISPICHIVPVIATHHFELLKFWNRANQRCYSAWQVLIRDMAQGGRSDKKLWILYDTPEEASPGSE